MKRVTKLTELICIDCSAVMPIWRRIGRLKKEGHIKHMWCYKCKNTTAHAEKRI